MKIRKNPESILLGLWILLHPNISANIFLITIASPLLNQRTLSPGPGPLRVLGPHTVLNSHRVLGPPRVLGPHRCLGPIFPVCPFE